VRRLARQITTPANAYILASIGVTVLFGLIAAAAVAIYSLDVNVGPRPLYRHLLREDGWVETLTAVLLAAAAIFALIAAWRMPETLRWSRPFFLLFAVFSLLMALEEISWGQRLFGIESGEFFTEHSDQNEFNLHNVLQLYLKQQGSPLVWTRKIAALVLVIYGVFLPILNRFEPFARVFRRLRLVVPPSALVLGFWLGAFLAWADWPTGREEELGEFLFGLCFALLVPLWLLQQLHVPGSEAPALARPVPI
jgi:hypothetical protein